MSKEGRAVGTRVDEVSLWGRNTQGVRVIRTGDGEALVSVSRIAEDDIDAAASAAVLADDAAGSESDGIDGTEE